MSDELERVYSAGIRDAATDDPELQQMSYELVSDLVGTHPLIDAVQLLINGAGEKLILVSLDPGAYANPDEAWFEERCIQYEDHVRLHEHEGFFLYFLRPDGVIARWQFGPTEDPPTLDDYRQALVESDVPLDRWSVEQEHEGVLQGVDFDAAISDHLRSLLASGRFVFRRSWPSLKEVEEELTRLMADALRMNAFSWGSVQRRADDLGYALNLEQVGIEPAGYHVGVSFNYGSLTWSE